MTIRPAPGAFAPQAVPRAIRRTLAWLALCLGLCMALAATPARADALVAVPPLTARVTDLTQTLTPPQQAALEAQLAGYEKQRGSQIFVLMVPSTAPETLDQYSIRVADAWKAGRKGIDDGVIVLIAKDNPPDLRRMRVEVGLGLQGSLTDAMSGRILRDIMAPHFRQGDFYGGLSAGVAAIESVASQESLPPPSLPAAKPAHAGLSDFLPVLFILFVIVLVVVLEPRRRFAGGLPQQGVAPDGRPRVFTGQRGRFGPGTLGGLGGLGGLGWPRGGGFGGGFGGDPGGGDIGGGFGGGGGGGFDGGGASSNW